MSMVKYCYLHGNRRHVSIARKIDRENNLVVFGFSVCHPNDTFQKSLGREIAEGRMNSKTRVEVELVDGYGPLECLMRHLAKFPLSNTWQPTALYSGSQVPRCVRDLARNWVNERNREHSLGNAARFVGDLVAS